MSQYNDVMDAEENGSVKSVQKLINSGMAWKLQGSFGRQAMDYIEAGLCVLGVKGCRDYYGNYVPSRFEVKSGSKGSLAYQKMMKEIKS